MIESRPPSSIPVRPSLTPGAAPSASFARPPLVSSPMSRLDKGDSDPIELVEGLEEEHSQPHPAQKIRAFGPVLHQVEHQWKRTPHKSGAGAIRMKSFHGKYSDQGLEYLDNAVNEWLDNHPEVEVKFVTSTVAVFEGKIREPALVLNVWY